MDTYVVFFPPRKEFLSPTVLWAAYDLQIPPGEAERVDTKLEEYIHFEKQLGKGHPSLKDCHERYFSKSTKNKLWQQWLVKGLVIVTRHTILGAWP